MNSPQKSAAPGPDNDAVQAYLQNALHASKGHATIQTLIHTDEGRPIDAITLTDPTVPDEDKQNVLIVAGQHGNEETARLVALHTIGYLLTDAAAETLQKQKIVVIPNLSPDAAARDAYDTPAGVRPNLDHGADGPVSNEAKALEMAAKALVPDVYVDIHAMGHSGCGFDMVMFAAPREYLEDEMILHQIAQQMAAEGERSGIPHVVHPLTWSGWGGNDPNEPSSTLWMYRNFKSIVFLVESAEDNSGSNPEAMRIASGVGRMKALFAVGNQRHPKLFHPGYPCNLASGMFNRGVVAAGHTAAERRASRLAIWKHVGDFRKVQMKIPEPYSEKTLIVDYQGAPIATPLGFQIRSAGLRRLKTVAINGTRLQQDECPGYYTWQDDYTTFAVAVVPSLEPGRHEIDFHYHE